MSAESRAWIELNREHLCRNAALLKGMVPKACALMPAVKADAYGHGAVWVSRTLQELGIRHFCVATAEEGAGLRRAKIRGQILVLGYTHPADFPLLMEYGLTQTIVNADYARQLNEWAGMTAEGRASQSAGPSMEVHVGIDTGMHRLGESFDEPERIAGIWRLSHLRVTGVFSHLCTSDGSSPEDRAYTELQETRFREVISDLRRRGLSGFLTHLQGSYGILNYPDMRYDLARPGIALYGVPKAIGLLPVLSLKARVACVRELKAGEGAGYGLAFRTDGPCRLATVTIGYADGLPRALSNRGHALINGQRVPIAGRICMDQLLLDVTKARQVQPGDEVVLIGRSGELSITAEELAEDAGTIPNEILCRLGKRLTAFPCQERLPSVRIRAADRDRTGME